MAEAKVAGSLEARSRGCERKLHRLCRSGNGRVRPGDGHSDHRFRRFLRRKRLDQVGRMDLRPAGGIVRIFFSTFAPGIFSGMDDVLRLEGQPQVADEPHAGGGFRGMGASETSDPMTDVTAGLGRPSGTGRRGSNAKKTPGQPAEPRERQSSGGGFPSFASSQPRIRSGREVGSICQAEVPGLESPRATILPMRRMPPGEARGFAPDQIRFEQVVPGGVARLADGIDGPQPPPQLHQPNLAVADVHGRDRERPGMEFLRWGGNDDGECADRGERRLPP